MTDKISLSLFLLLLISYSAANAQTVNLEAAKTEGRIVLYGTVVPQAMESIFNSFEKKYGIKVDYWRASDLFQTIDAALQIRTNNVGCRHDH